MPLASKARKWRSSRVWPPNGSRTLGPCTASPRRRPTPATSRMAETSPAGTAEELIGYMASDAGSFRNDPFHRVHDFADRPQQAAKIGRFDRADAADAK